MNRLLFASAMAAFGTQAAMAGSVVTINEIRIDQSGTDNDQYVELFSNPAGGTLAGLTYLVIGDGTGGSGVIEAVVDLTAQSFPMGDSFFVMAEATFTLGTADLTTTLNFENSDNVTHLLVNGFTGSNGDDLDTNDDCVLDTTPWTGVIDGVAMIEEANPPTGTECHYGTDLGVSVVGPDGSFVPGQIGRDPDGTGSWVIGQFDTASGTDSPGATNTGTVPVELMEFQID